MRRASKFQDWIGSLTKLNVCYAGSVKMIISWLKIVSA